jgi:hypothetical protein
MSHESQIPQSSGDAAGPEAPAPTTSSADDTLARGKSGEGAHSALAALKRLQARGLLNAQVVPDPEAED